VLFQFSILSLNCAGSPKSFSRGWGGGGDRECASLLELIRESNYNILLNGWSITRGICNQKENCCAWNPSVEWPVMSLALTLRSSHIETELSTIMLIYIPALTEYTPFNIELCLCGSTSNSIIISTMTWLLTLSNHPSLVSQASECHSDHVYPVPLLPLESKER
jgi:hypothetical protein